jgi:hypothetical protein
MAQSYKWNCKTVDVHPSEGGNSDVVYNVHWSILATSDQKKPQQPALPSDDAEPVDKYYSASVYGTQVVPAPEGAFIPFADLTEAEVEAWTKEAMGDEEVASLYAGLDSQIEAEINPTSVQMQIGGPVE